MASLPSPAVDVSSIAPCCICMEVKDYHSTMLIECTKCGIRVHVKCYGLSLEGGDASSWLCQPCAHMSQSSPPPAVAPQCAVCPIAGGALRLTDQTDVWCHVLCINWIPELYHSLAGAMDEAVEIALLDRSRSSLKCLVCGLRGGCIQCVSGRCAKAFHVLCAFRSPSSLIFTGYNTESQQVYHCKGHLSDVSSRRYEMVDNSWRTLPEVQKFVADHPLTEGKCRFCSNKIAAAGRESHETQCLLGWLSRRDADRRKKELDRLGLKPPQISYAKKNIKSPSKKNGKNRGKNRTSNDHVNGSPSARNGKYKRHPVPMRDCPECGEPIRETLMMGHLKNSCPRSRHANGSKLKRNRMMSPRNFGNGAIQEETEAADLSDVLFASWPGQNSGAPMDSTYFWKVMENHFFSSKMLEKKRMEQLSKSLCGVKLDELAKSYGRRALQSTDIHCRDTLHLERTPEDPTQTLSLQKLKHRCDFLMRASHCRCMSDTLARPMIEISSNAQIAEPATLPTTDQVYETIPEDAKADIRVLIKNGDGGVMDCKYSMRVSREGTTNQATGNDGTFASSFQHDVISTLKGIDMSTKKVPLAKDDHLMISLDQCNSVEPCENGLQLTDKFRAPAHTELMTDELTPAINLLMEHLKDKMEQNRYRVRALYKKLQQKEGSEGKFQLKAQTTEMYYREFASWKQLCASLVIGYKYSDQKEQENPKSESEEQDTEEEDDSLDDGTCVVCFDGQSPESNPIVFCDRCELAVHQRCYGIAKVPSSEFVCDRCRVTREGLDPASHVFCQLCSLGDGAFKRTVDGKWVHVVCALWCPNVWIGNLFELSDISLVGNNNQVRFVDPVKEIDSRMAQVASSNQHIALKTSDHASHPEVSGLELGSLCVHCRVACGRTIQCCHPNCTTSFHPLCGWFDGLPMTISHRDRGYMYAGGGAGLDFQMFCASHLPADYSSDEQSAQKRRRARFRIDSFFVIRNKANLSGGGKKQEDSGLLSGAIVQALISAENKRAATGDDPHATDWTDMTVCSACFEHCAPIVGELTDVNMLHRRQFMIRCQYCNVYIHPECCISDIGSSATIFRSNWICERCTQAGGKETSGCVVCAQSTDYLMPCVDPPISTAIPVMQALPGSKSLSTAIRAAPGGGQQLWLQAHQNMLRQQNAAAHTNHNSQQLAHEGNGTASPASNRWIHVYCSKWQKARTVKRHHILCAYTPALSSMGTAMRCEICFEKKGAVANCAQCHSRFHPICAAKKKLYCARSNRTDWKFYCEAHPPLDAAFDNNRQTWVTQEIMSQLQDLRRSLERGRMLLEMSRQRDRQHKRLLNTCKLPLMEASIEVILKRRPTAQMKEVYHELTGEKLTDVPPRPKPAPPSPRGSSPRLRSSPRAARPTRSVTKRSATQTATPERSSKRRRTGSGDSNAATTRTDRRSSKRKSLHHNQESSDGEDMDDTDEQNLGDLRKFLANLSVPKKSEDFDSVIEQEFPELLE